MSNGLDGYARSLTQSYIESQRKNAIDKVNKNLDKKVKFNNSKVPDLIRNVKNTSKKLNK